MMRIRQMAAQPAGDVMGFGYGEHLLVWSWRHIAAGTGHCRPMAREFEDACGEDAGEVFLTFCAFLKALAFAGRRQLTVGAPDSLAVTPDERRILMLIAAAQANMPALIAAHLNWLARPERRHVLEVATCALARALVANALRLEPPSTDARAQCCRPRLVIA